MGLTVRAVELELDNFKSFGKRTNIPLADGFTTISGPNGSGKSNILDSILFVLGLTTAKTLRAERLPDLINNQNVEKRTASVRLRLTAESDDPNVAPRILEIARVIRVNDDNYSSTYYLDGRVSTLAKIHEELSALSISPTGNNIILQGDVTRICTMSNLERRRIVDELAGVAEFDERIDAARDEMDKAQRHMEDLGIVADELNVRLRELEGEKNKALTYKGLRDRKEELEAVLLVAERNDVERRLREAERDQQKLDDEQAAVRAKFPELAQKIEAARAELERVEAEIRAKGEEEKLAKLQALEEAKGAIQREEDAIASLRRQATDVERQDAARSQEEERATEETSKLQAQATASRDEVARAETRIKDWQDELKQLYEKLENLNVEQTGQSDKLTNLREQLTEAKLEEGRTAVALAAAAERVLERTAAREQSEAEHAARDGKAKELEQILADSQETRKELAAEVERAQRKLDGTKWEITKLRGDRDRLDAEYRELSREFTREEARAKVTSQMSSDRAVRSVLEAGIKGIHGTVAQLVSVPSDLQVAAEVAAGRRLSHVVVDDENVAARCIEHLKREGSGRVTFLPLTKIRGSAPDHQIRLEGTRGYLINLLSYKPRYQDIFGHVFGDTVVVEKMDRALQLIGQFRMVTVEGELFERSGAVTGGSHQPSARLQFAVDLEGLKRRLLEKEEEGKRVLKRLTELDEEFQKAQGYVEEARRNLGALEVDLQRDGGELSRAAQDAAALADKLGALRGQERDGTVEHETLVSALGRCRERLARLDQEMRDLEQTLGDGGLEKVHRRIAELEGEVRALNETIRTLQERIRLAELELAYHKRNVESWRAERAQLAERRGELQADVAARQALIKQHMARRNELDRDIAGIADRLGEFRGVRDGKLKALEDLRAERLDLEGAIRQCEDRRVLVEERRREHQARMAELDEELARRPQQDLKVLKSLTPGKIKREIATLDEQMKAMEPVNMLALEQHTELAQRAAELAQKLDTLNQEKSALKERMTSFGRQKFEAFMAAFRRVAESYAGVYAELSDGEGELVLEHPDDPFAGGLMIKARPAGKKMERIEALSGGEKSLAALAFMFALQSHNPAPFYVFDEVDMFLDGNNTERLAAMLRRQADGTQFLVVSLRRAMLERSHRTIGVTQTRNGFSQVTGIELDRFDQNGKTKEPHGARS